MTREHIATIDAALLHEALNRANKVAPTKGSPMDRAAGIQIKFLTDAHGVGVAHVRATDLDVTFYQKVACQEISEECTIRVSSVVPPFVASLGMDKGQVIRFHREEKNIVVQYNKTRTAATIPQITGEYPNVMWYDYDEMTDASELANKVAAVAWAVEGDADGVLSGIKIDGEWLEALSSKNAARIRCDLDGDRAPVIAVLKTLVPLIKSGSKVRMRTDPGRIVVALDEVSQVTSTTVMGQWPNLVERLEKFEFPNTVTMRKTRITEALKRVLSFVRNDRLPKIILTFTSDSVDVILHGTLNGDVQDSCAMSDRSGSDEDISFTFNPIWLLEAMETFPGATIKIDFNGPLQPIRLMEPSTSYEAYVMPMQGDD